MIGVDCDVRKHPLENNSMSLCDLCLLYHYDHAYLPLPKRTSSLVVFLCSSEGSVLLTRMDSAVCFKPSAHK